MATIAVVSDGATTRAEPSSPFGGLGRRVTYLMLFRVGVVTLLLGATFVSELGELAAPIPRVESPRSTLLFGLIAATYGLTIVYALALRRATRLEPWAAAQLGIDLVFTTALVHLTGDVESVFAFMYLIVIVGASLLHPRGALAATVAAVLLYAGVVLGHAWLPFGVRPAATVPLRALVRALAINGVAFAATGALAGRLAVELSRASERIASQGLQLRDLAALHEDVIRCLTSGLITLTEDGRVATLNAAAEEILRVEAAPTVGRHIDALLPGLRPLVEGAPQMSALRRAEIAYRGASGAALTLGVSVSRLVDPSGRAHGRIVNFQDLTDLRRMQEAMARAEQLAAVGRLAAAIAHEIRNPLAAISGSIELLAQGAGDGNKESAELMAIVLREVERLNALITELLDFARPRRPEPQPLDLGATLGELVRVFANDKRLMGAAIELRSDGPVWSEVDPSQLRQVMWNLLRNAVEASPPAAPVTVEVKAEGAWASVTVRDRGPGMTPEHRARIFEPFFSTKEGGTGLGLATVHRIVEEHHGRIEVESPPDGGTAFTIRLPSAAPPG
jgi:two-component system sensor histidine kinase PilS (NtrC family)